MVAFDVSGAGGSAGRTVATNILTPKAATFSWGHSLSHGHMQLILLVSVECIATLTRAHEVAKGKATGRWTRARLAAIHLLHVVISHGIWCGWHAIHHHGVTYGTYGWCQQLALRAMDPKHLLPWAQV